VVERNVVVFAGKYASSSTVEHVEAVAGEFPHWRITILQEFPPRHWRKYLQGKLRLLRRQPISCPLEILAAILRLAAGTLARFRRRPVAGSTASPALPESLARLTLPNVVHRRVSSLRDPEVVSSVRDLNPWLGISLGAPILRAPLFRAPELGTVNLHKSLLPEYRGMPPGFWELHNAETKTGASVHWVDESLDTGEIISQRELPIPEYSTPDGLKVQLDVLGTETLLDALHKIENGCLVGTPQTDPGRRPNRQPPWLLARKVRRRLWNRRRPKHTPPALLRTALKHVVLAFYVLLWVPIRNRVRSMRGTCHTAVLLYHRVDDAFLDSVTLGVEQFDRQLSVLKRNYEVLDLASFLQTRGRPRRRPAVVITFDDGYASKYLAAVLLRRHGLPATFFLSTGMIGTDQPFSHDVQRLGKHVPALTWEQVETMTRRGFTFGVHTVNHARLSALPREEALAEVAEAKAALDFHTGPTEASRCLAYPYGKKTDISDDVRQSLASVGIDWCLSAYGGVNRPDWDPLDVLRCGCDWSYSSLAFRAVLEGWTRPGE